MKPILIYAGTTEGRQLAEYLSGAEIPCIVCVATEYGRQAMPSLPGVCIHEGRMDVEQMRRLARQEEVAAIVDGTHPFATEVTRNIRESAEAPYFRLHRSGGPVSYENAKGVQWFWDHKSCIEKLNQTEGNILLTTGSKELMNYCSALKFKERLYVRVLPGLESLTLCQDCGIPGKQIIAMQGPFSREMNEALIRQLRIEHLVTKESGIAGGFPEKLEAARRTGISAYVIGNPDREEGYSFEELIPALARATGYNLSLSAVESAFPKSKNREELQISLIGMGMGSVETLTLGAQKALSEADHVFGAARLIREVPQRQHPLPYYLAKDILPELEKINRSSDGKSARIAILFSGDTGFYSGCKKMRENLIAAGYKNIRIYPGISSLHYISASIGVDWQNIYVISLHGKGDFEGWKAEVLESLRYREKTFLLMSGVKDMQQFGKLLLAYPMEHCRIYMGYQMSYPEEEIRLVTPKECSVLEKEGLYCCLILNPGKEKKPIARGFSDEEFIRDKVPMTKEEIRALAIRKLHLTEGGVVYDVGSGTGSVAVEIAAVSSSIQVYAIEKKPLAADLIRKNCQKHRILNVQVVEGLAPAVLADLPKPDFAFIGGSSGNLREILEVLYEKNPDIRVVITAISLETIAEIQDLLQDERIGNQELIQLQTSRSRKVGAYHLMQGENPVYIASLTFH